MTQELDRELVRAGLLRFPPPGNVFPGRSGPDKTYVFDARGAGANPKLRGLLVHALRIAVGLCPPFEVVAGIAKSGTVWAAWLAWAEGIPFANVLIDGPRTSGLRREVEGDVAGKRVLILDNWISTGESVRKAADVLRRAGAAPIAVLTLVSAGPRDFGLPQHTALNIDSLLEVARDEGLWTPPTGLLPKF